MAISFGFSYPSTSYFLSPPLLSLVAATPLVATRESQGATEGGEGWRGNRLRGQLPSFVRANLDGKLAE